MYIAHCGANAYKKVYGKSANFKFKNWLRKYSNAENRKVLASIMKEKRMFICGQKLSLQYQCLQLYSHGDTYTDKPTPPALHPP